MKTFKGFAYVAMAWCIPLFLQAKSAFTIKDAVTQKKVAVKLVSNGKHVGKCVTFTIKNLADKPISVLIDAGRRLKNHNSDNQDLIVTQQLLVQLKPKQTTNIPIYAMCGEAKDASPKSTDNFTIAENDNADLKGLALLIYKRNFQTDAGQHAIWTITDGYDAKEIVSADTLEQNTLRRYVSALAYVKNTAVAGVPAKKINLYTGFTLFERKQVTVQVLDAQGNVLKTFINDYPFTAGSHSLRYEFATEAGEVKTYLLKIIANNEMVLQREFKL